MRVGQIDARFQTEPKVREFVGKGVFARHIVGLNVSRANKQTIRRLFNLANKRGNVRCKMLPVAVDCYRVGVTVGLCAAQTSFQGGAFTTVLRVRNNLDVSGFSQNIGGTVGRAVVHHNNMVGVLPDVGHNLRNGLAVVVCRDDNHNVEPVESVAPIVHFVFYWKWQR